MAGKWLMAGKSHAAGKPVFTQRWASLAGTLLLMLVLGGEATGQAFYHNARNMGMGGGGTAYMSGYSANFVNPANLLLDQQGTRLEVGLLGGLSAGAGGSLANISVYNQYMTRGLLLDGPSAHDMANDWIGLSPRASGRIGAQFDMVPVGASYRINERMAASMALRYRVMGGTELSKGLFQLAFRGLDDEVFGDPREVGFSFEAYNLAEISVGLSREVWHDEAEGMRIMAGAAPKLLMGMNYAQATFDSQLQVLEDQQGIIHDFSYSLRSAGEVTGQLQQYHNLHQEGEDPDLFDMISDGLDQAGDNPVDQVIGARAIGLGLDLGATMMWDLVQPIAFLPQGDGQTLYASLSVTDIGGLTFSGSDAGVFGNEGVFEWEGADIDLERMEEDHGDFSGFIDHLADSIANKYTDIQPTGSEFSVGLTPMLNIGAALQADNLLLSADFNQGLNERGTNAQSLSMSLGAEYAIAGMVPVRGGLRMGGASSQALTLGTGLRLRNFEFTFSAMATPASGSRGSHAAGAWSGLVFRF